MPTIGHYRPRDLLLEMERDLQISGLSDIDKRVMSTMVHDEDDMKRCINDIRNHALTPIPAPSLYRSFQTLIKMGCIKKVGSARSGLYQLTPS